MVLKDEVKYLNVNSKEVHRKDNILNFGQVETKA